MICIQNTGLNYCNKAFICINQGNGIGHFLLHNPKRAWQLSLDKDHSIGHSSVGIRSVRSSTQVFSKKISLAIKKRRQRRTNDNILNLLGLSNERCKLSKDQWQLLLSVRSGEILAGRVILKNNHSCVLTLNNALVRAMSVLHPNVTDDRPDNYSVVIYYFTIPRKL